MNVGGSTAEDPIIFFPGTILDVVVRRQSVEIAMTGALAATICTLLRRRCVRPRQPITEAARDINTPDSALMDAR